MKKWCSISTIGFLLITVCCFAVYFSTRSDGAYPGRSALVVAQAMDNFVRLSPREPLSFEFIKFVLKYDHSQSLVLLHAVMALFAAASVGLLWLIVALTLRPLLEAADDMLARWIEVLAGCVACVAFGLSLPFWTAANRADGVVLTVFMLMSCTLLLVIFSNRTRRLTLCTLCFLYGIGVVESSVFTGFAPLFLAAVIYILWREEQLSARILLPAVLCGGVGLFFYSVPLLRFHGTEGFILRGYSGFRGIMIELLKNQYAELMHGLPKYNWLIILGTTVIPWITTLFLFRKHLAERWETGIVVLHAVITLTVVIVIVNLPLSPWRLIGQQGSMTIPYLMVATMSGYLAAYWALAPLGWFGGDEASAGKRRMGLILGAALAAPLVLCSFVMPFVVRTEADAGDSSAVQYIAQEYVKTMNKRAITWLISDGMMDHSILIAAALKNKPLRIINLGGASVAVYRKYVGGFFDAPRLRNLADVDMYRLIDEWLADGTNIEHVAVSSNPDLLLGRSIGAIPDKLMFIPDNKKTHVDLVNMASMHTEFLRELQPFAKYGRSSQTNRVGQIVNAAVMRAGMVANNLGVMLEEAGDMDRARKLYTEILSVDPDNVSAALNLLRSSGGKEKDNISQLELMNERAIAGKRELWMLAAVYGYVRDYKYFEEKGYNWVRSGRQARPVTSLQERWKLYGDSSADSWRRVAGLSMLRQEYQQSEEVYEDILKNNADDYKAQIGMALVTARKGEWEKAQDWLIKAKSGKAPLIECDIAEGVMLYLKGRDSDAVAIFKRILDQDGTRVDANVILASLAMNQSDDVLFNSCVQRLLRVRDGVGFGKFLQGQSAVKKGDLVAARGYLEDAAGLLPAYLVIREMILNLDIKEKKFERFKESALAILRFNPDHALANYILGSVRIKEGQYDLAEDVIRRSLKIVESPAAYNDLAWLLDRKGDLVKAEEMARKSLGMQMSFEAWDTLGVIQKKVGNLEDAEKSFKNALSLGNDPAVVCFHMADLYIQKGNVALAREYAVKAAGLEAILSAEDKKAFAQLLKRLKMSE